LLKLIAVILLTDCFTKTFISLPSYFNRMVAFWSTVSLKNNNNNNNTPPYSQLGLCIVAYKVSFGFAAYF